jgi:hypothetical protein
VFEGVSDGGREGGPGREGDRVREIKKEGRDGEKLQKVDFSDFV